MQGTSLQLKMATYAVVEKKKAEIFSLVHLPFEGILQNKLMTSSQLVCQLNLLVRALHWCCRGHSSNPSKPELFQAFFLQLQGFHSLKVLEC